jgi:hypothetical protein
MSLIFLALIAISIILFPVFSSYAQESGFHFRIDPDFPESDDPFFRKHYGIYDETGRRIGDLHPRFPGSDEWTIEWDPELDDLPDIDSDIFLE